MPAAIAIPAIIGAAGVGTQLVGAHNAASAAKKAAALQVASTDKAQQFTERAYADQQKAMNPYMQMGQNAMASYGQRYGGANPYQPMTQVGPQSFAAPAPMMPAPQGNPYGPILGAALQGAQAPPGAPMGGPPLPTAAQASGGLVTLRAPNGQTQQVPAAQAEAFIQRGAVRVS